MSHGDRTLGSFPRGGQPPRRDELAAPGKLHPAGGPCWPRTAQLRFRSTSRETEDEFVVKASLPGVKPDDVQITVHGDTLTIRGESKAEEEKKGEHWHLRERRFGTFQRACVLATGRFRQGPGPVTSTAS